MCLAVPGRIIETDGRHGKADFGGNILPVELGAVDAKIGDFVLVHAGCAISVLPKDEAQELQQLLNDLSEISQ